MGLAVGDAASGVVTPLRVVPYGGAAAAAETIAAEARRCDATVVVVGLPTSEDGAETPACARSHALARELARLGLEVALQPEHLSTVEAKRRAREAGAPRSRPVDDLAAQIVVEDHLARRSRGGG